MIIASLVSEAGALPVTAGNAVEPVTETSAFIDGFIGDIDSAEHHFHLMFYIVEDDEVGRLVADPRNSVVWSVGCSRKPLRHGRSSGHWLRASSRKRL